MVENEPSIEIVVISRERIEELFEWLRVERIGALEYAGSSIPIHIWNRVIRKMMDIFGDVIKDGSQEV